MKVKTLIILMSLLVLISILFIRSTSIFALPDENCYCHDTADAWEVCIEYCGLGEKECLYCYLITTKGVCNDSTYCQMKWQIICTDWYTQVQYWQSTWCPEDCWLWVNQFWKTNRVEDIVPAFLLKVIKIMWIG
jgi:hypothetical protein